MLVGSIGSAVMLVGRLAPATYCKKKLLLTFVVRGATVTYSLPLGFRLLKTSCWTLCTHSLPPVAQLLPVCGCRWLFLHQSVSEK